MKLFTTGDRPYALLAAVLCITAAVLFDPGIRSDAESRGSAQVTSTGNLLPPNSARMKFVSSGSNARETAASLAAENIDASSMRALSLASGDLNGDGFPDL